MVILLIDILGFIGKNFIKYYLKRFRDSKLIKIDKFTYTGERENQNEIIKNLKYYKSNYFYSL
tara:strand:- start:311 stop:499 length:189 start_codon:yes stop_codon:yes gene_type:complete